MKNEIIGTILEYIRSASKEIIQKNYAEEIIVFNHIWEVMRGFISERKDISPENWSIYESPDRLMIGLGFIDPSQVSNLTAPIIIGVLAATFWHIGMLKDEPERSDIEKMIEIYSGKFNVTEKAKKLLKEYLPSPDLVSLIRKEMVWDEGERKREGIIEESAPKAIKEKAYARVWTLKTDDPERGDLISMQEYDEILKNKDNTALIIIKTNGFKDLYVYGNDKNLSHLRYDLLEYVLKHGGCGGDVLNLLENVWKSKVLAKDLKKELKKAKKAGNEKSIKLEIYAKTGHIRKAVSELNKFFKEKNNVDLKTLQKGQYKLTHPLKYYLIEII